MSRNDLAARLGTPPRGPGFTLSTTAPVEPPVVEAESQNAEVPKRKKAAQPIRSNRGISVRDDLIYECKRLALDNKRKLYEVLEEALTEYLQRRGRLPGGVGEGEE